MTSKRSGVYKSIAAVLVLTISQVYILASPGRAIFGRLATSANSVISVNGSEGRTGTTILSGTQLQTPDNTTATVRLDSGILNVLPNTNLTLTFSEGRVDVNVLSGGAFLTANKGVNGSLTFNGKTERTDPSKDFSTVEGGTPAPPQVGMSNSWSGKKTAWTLAGIGGAITVIVIVATHGNDSPS